MHQQSSPLEEVLVVVLVVVVTTAVLEEQLERRFYNVHWRKWRGAATIGVFVAAILVCQQKGCWRQCGRETMKV
eukprot:6069317-Ditylum_brightwellii.AAC.1